MSVIRMVICDICKAQVADPPDWYLVRDMDYNGRPAVIIQSEYERLLGRPRATVAIYHCCSFECLHQATEQIVSNWIRQSPKDEDEAPEEANPDLANEAQS